MRYKLLCSNISIVMDQIKMDFVGRRTLSVSELTGRIKSLLEENFGSIWVEGEVSNYSRPASGHQYFTLKDAGAQIRCVMFRQQSLYAKILPKDGMKLLVHARVAVYEPRGEYQLMVDRIEPLGIGALELAFRQLKERLDKEGLFDPKFKKPIPEVSRKIGVVTSLTGAVVRDIIRTITSRSNLVDMLITPVKVQGEGAAKEIADAIELLDGGRNPWGKLDAIIVGRGGGSLEDLWAFNEEIVARAIFNCRTPVISAVGHETDFSISDFVADLRAATPTAAAQMVSPRSSDLLQKFESGKSRMNLAVINSLRHREEKVSSLGRLIPNPRHAVEERELRLDELASRMQRIMQSGAGLIGERLAGLGAMLSRVPLIERIDRKHAASIDSMKRLQHAALRRMDASEAVLRATGARLGALNPLAVLDRGYSLTRKADGTVVRNAGQVEAGDELSIRLAEGNLTAEVKNKEL